MNECQRRESNDMDIRASGAPLRPITFEKGHPSRAQFYLRIDLSLKAKVSKKSPKKGGK